MYFDKLAPFIQEYIYKNKWEELREIQVAACDIIFNQDANLLITTPTASGKTEAAFLPAITKIYNEKPSSVGILYIAPLKALINDQFVRIEELLYETEINVTKWHGDVSESDKCKLLSNPSGILQITPESLEAMLMNRKSDVETLFGNLQFVIIDEMHHFIEGDRGIQLSCILERIQKITKNVPRRIGLSATIGNVSLAEEWLNGETNRECVVPIVSSKRKNAIIMVDHFESLPESIDPKQKSSTPYYEKIYDLVHNKKSIIFSNSRIEVEKNILWLRKEAKKRNHDDRFLVHHGNISASNRQYVEEKMKQTTKSNVIGATVTLELGIDLGDLERVIQTGSPFSVSSMAQRLGRSGRRNSIPEMCFLFNKKANETTGFCENVDWLFLKCLAIIELYREKWIEPIKIDDLPYNVVYHQTMSFIHSYGSIQPKFLAQNVLKKKAFAKISQDDFKDLLLYMLEKEHLEKLEDGSLALGPNGENITNNYKFYSVFDTPEEYSVRDKIREIGTLNKLAPKNSKFVLNGMAWKVTEVDKDRKIIYVTKVQNGAYSRWDPVGIGSDSTKVLQKISEILYSEFELPYLTTSANKRLKKDRLIMKKSGILNHNIIEFLPGNFYFMPLLGTESLNAFVMLLEYKIPNCKITISSKLDIPIIITFENTTKEEIIKAIEFIKQNDILQSDLKLPKKIYPVGKYGEFVPEKLKVKQYFSKFVDIKEMKLEISKWNIR